MDMTNLEPNVFLRQGTGRRIDNVFETLQRLATRIKSGHKTRTYLKTLNPLVLLFVYYTESEVDLICFLEIRLYVHNLRERFFGVIVAAISIVQYTNTIPQHRILRCLVSILRAMRIFRLVCNHSP